MGMYLMRQIGTRGVYANPVLPDFMVFLNWQELPVYWYGFNWFPYAMLMVLLVPGAARLRVRLVRLPQPRHRRLFLDHHPGADLRADARLLPQRHRLRRQQRPHRLQGHPRLQRAGRRRPAPRCSRSPAWRSLVALLHVPLHRHLEVRQGADRDPRRRSAHPLPRLPTSSPTSSSSSRCRPAWPASPARSTCRRSASSIPSEFAPANSIEDRDLGRGRRPRHADRARSSARSWSTTARPISPAACSRRYWLFVLGGLFVVRHAAPAARASSARIAALAGREAPQAESRRSRRRAAGRRAAAGGVAVMRDETDQRAASISTASPSLRRLPGAERPLACGRARRDARHHRPERRRQDHDDGRRHRQDAARRGRRLLRAADVDLTRLDESRDRRARHRPQVPEADGVREPHRVRAISSSR